MRNRPDYIQSYVVNMHFIIDVNKCQSEICTNIYEPRERTKKNKDSRETTIQIIGT